MSTSTFPANPANPIGPVVPWPAYVIAALGFLAIAIFFPTTTGSVAL